MSNPVLVKGAIYFADPIEGTIWHEPEVNFQPGYAEYIGYDVQHFKPVFKFKTIRHYNGTYNPIQESTWYVAANQEALQEFLGEPK